MTRPDEGGDALDGVSRIHAALDRLRQMVATATVLDIKATSERRWSTNLARGGDAAATEHDE